MSALHQVPVLAPDVPCTIVPSSGHRRAARLARCLLDAGVIQGKVSASSASDPAKVSRAHLQRWIEEQIGPLHCLYAGFNFYLAQTEDFDQRSGEEGGRRDAHLAWFAKPGCWTIGPALQRLEDLQAGLGTTVLGVLQEKSWGVMPLFTPREASGVAQEIYWYGEEDESFAIEESCGDDVEAAASMRAEMVTKAKLQAAYPSWASSWRSRPAIGVRRLRELATSVASPKVRAVVEDTIALKRLRLGDEFKPDHDGWFDGYAAVLCWSDDDITVRVYDDFSQYVWEGGEAFDSIGEHEFQLDGPESFLAWADAMQPSFLAMRLIDRLIHTLSSGDWRRIPKGFR